MDSLRLCTIREKSHSTGAQGYSPTAPEKSGEALAPVVDAEKEHKLERALMFETEKYLNGYPVNMPVDLSLIPRESDGLTQAEAEAQLDENMETLARLMAWHNMLGLDVRYVLVHKTDKKYKRNATRILEKKLERLAEIPGARLNVEKLFTLHTKSSASQDIITVQLMDVEDIRTMKRIPNRIYPVALQRNKEAKGLYIPNYKAASTIGLSLAALRVASEKESKEVYKRKVKDVLPKIKSIYKNCGVNVEKFDVDVLNMLVNFTKGSIDSIIKFALPPVMKAAIETLNEYHRAMQFTLQAA